jgi:glycerol-3-phosphate dehydrogenase (NAD(P)+)
MGISIFGAGSWGTALAVILAKKGIDVTLWARNEEFAFSVREKHENTVYLPGIIFPENLYVTSSVADAVSKNNIFLIVVPSHGLRAASKDIAKALFDFPENQYYFVSASKGIENETLCLMTDIFKEEFAFLKHKHNINFACLSGPSFAREVAHVLPTAVVIASESLETSGKLQELFSTDTFRVYASADITGVQLGGALKNVIAISSGICDGIGLGTNARAALITRGLYEIMRLGAKMGANPHTFSGLAGLGDLVLTCTGELSRNRSVGLKLGQGQKISEIISDMKMVAEGVKTSLSAYNLSKKYDIEMPITEEVYNVLYNDKPAMQSVKDLMNRPLKQEAADFI